MPSFRRLIVCSTIYYTIDYRHNAGWARCPHHHHHADHHCWWSPAIITANGPRVQTQTAGTPRQLGTGEKQDNWSLVLSMQVLSSIFNPHDTCVSISCVHWNIVLIELLHASYNPAYNKQNDWYLTLHWHVTLRRWEPLMIDWVSDYSLCPVSSQSGEVSSVLFLASDPCSTVIRPTPADPPHPGRGAMCKVTSRYIF